jgi:hypothetical protein
MMIGYDIYDCFTMEYFALRQSMILTTIFFLTVNLGVDWGLVVKLALPAKVTRRANKVLFGIYDSTVVLWYSAVISFKRRTLSLTIRNQHPKHFDYS